jgi:hypothetical protein
MEFKPAAPGFAGGFLAARFRIELRTDYPRQSRGLPGLLFEIGFTDN